MKSSSKWHCLEYIAGVGLGGQEHHYSYLFFPMGSWGTLGRHLGPGEHNLETIHHPNLYFIDEETEAQSG